MTPDPLRGCVLAEEHGPFDIVGDLHGCFDELIALLTKLGYRVAERADPNRLGYGVQPPEGRKAIFVGDLVDRGPNIPGVLRLVMGMTAAGTAFCVPGNHDWKLLRKLWGRNVRVSRALTASLAQIEAEPPEFKSEVVAFFAGLPDYYVLDNGSLVVAHAGLNEELQGEDSRAARDFALYGDTTGESDKHGFPDRRNWAAKYRGRAMVVYGHTPVSEAEWLNNTINIDTGCVFGGELTALRYPELELVSVRPARTYADPRRPLAPMPTD